MGLIKKKDRSDKRAASAGPGGTPPAVEQGARESGGQDAGAGNGPFGSEAQEIAFPAELRLAVEGVAASGEGTSTGGGADAYGLRAELQASRRRGSAETGERRPDDPATPAESEPGLALGGEPAVVAPVTAAGGGSTVPGPEIEGAGEPIDEPTAGEALDPGEADDPRDGGEASAAGAPQAQVEWGAGEQPGSFASEARSRLEALERSLVEKTESLREQAAALAERESELTRTGEEFDRRESRLAERLRELEAREEAVRAETERLEQEQAIWGDATRESRTRMTELQETLEAKERELAATAESQEARATELDRLGAELDARADRIAVAEDELAARAKELDGREALLREREEEIAERERRLSERETAVAGREAALDQTEAGVAERESSFDEREAELAAREEALAAEREQLERDREDWEAIMTGAFSRLNELETDLVSSLSLAGMLKRELEGREAGERRDRKGPGAGWPENDERRGSRNRTASDAEDGEPVLAGLESNGSSIPKGEAAPEQQMAESDWWARQLGRRKKV